MMMWCGVHGIAYHTIPYHTPHHIHTTPHHTTPYHTIPYHTTRYHTTAYMCVMLAQLKRSLTASLKVPGSIPGLAIGLNI